MKPLSKIRDGSIVGFAYDPQSAMLVKSAS